MNGTVKGTILFIDNRRVDDPSIVTKSAWRDEQKSDNFHIPFCLRRPNICGHQAEGTDVPEDHRAVGDTFPDEVMAHVDVLRVTVMERDPRQ